MPREETLGKVIRGHRCGGNPAKGRSKPDVVGLSSNGCGWVEARSAGRRGMLAARAASELTAHGVHLTGDGRGAPWPGGRSERSSYGPAGVSTRYARPSLR